jgi:Animal haem peroxidase
LTFTVFILSQEFTMSKPWHRLPLPFAVLALAKFRDRLRKNNLHSTADFSTKITAPPAPAGHQTARTSDGSYNDLEQPAMGMAGSRLGRNTPLAEIPDPTANLLNPSPREVSRRLMTRKEFIPATSLNVLAAAWIQFQNHDWFSHGDNQPDRHIDISLAADDDWPPEHRPIAIKETAHDNTRTNTTPPKTFVNHVTQWWDGSQIYGSTAEKVDRLRSHHKGKMTIGEDGLLPLDPALGIDDTGFNDNWWIGLSLLHTLFVKEHNYICDELHRRNPEWNDQELFDHARLIVAALTAKIHTVEWTPGILSHPAVQVAMSANWWGLLGQGIKKAIGRVSDNESISGIVGSPTDQHGAPYAMTEEFVSVYRLHPLIPDDLTIHAVSDNRVLLETNFFDVSGKRTRGLFDHAEVADVFYSLGIAHPGALCLNNYPRFLQQLQRDNGEVFDLAMIDILRDRERGVPRYNQFREMIGKERVKSFAEITSNQTWAKEMADLYQNDLEKVDLMVGLFAEDLPEGFGFSDTAFRVFILMASRRLKSDRFYTKDYRAEIYTQFGLDWIDRTTMSDLLKRHYPELAPSLEGVKNAFAPWRRMF